MKAKEKTSENAVDARRLYQNEWRAKNKDKVREYNKKHWEKRAEKAAQEKQEGDNGGS